MSAEDPDLVYARRRDALVTAAAVFDVIARHAAAPRPGAYVSEADTKKVVELAEFLLKVPR